MKKKILVHMIAITSFLIGIVFIHVVTNTTSSNLLFFNILVHNTVVIDSGLTLIGIAFFTEFYMSFKPIKIN